MMHSIELLLDERSDATVRTHWSQLTDAGLPSAGRHLTPTNRPHVTVLVSSRIRAEADAACAHLSMRFPIPMTIGAPILFGRPERVILARLVVPTAELLDLHAEVVDLSADHIADAPPPLHTAPGSWTPHVTIARRLDPEQLTRALDVADLQTPIDGRFVALRRWDSDARTETRIAGVR
ncbi:MULTISPECIES: 2'-5' RNA ligase family protein [unclassified Gordonia (in: high G+C Gram-positive bacteria)]|uniref:2'-5' RNA ligase family protein n=1 Tax=unclassified Gordonia (in: high G+C Gram-positive bacteria) TaxID=2657482 RepID=UPI001F108D2E|nr:2'-5' RNA ligase family protein [Gordonia sp. ABSL49_1]MCH5641409.1 2'-5' RNA ligase family protein [Gordonia sp. ABSL49_1]